MSAAPRTFDVGCTVRVSHRVDDLSAHVELDGEVLIGPGDRVVVHGGPIDAGWGEVRVERRTATVTRASRASAWWLKVRGTLECLSLLEIPFSEERDLSVSSSSVPEGPPSGENYLENT
jgi:hypothetical protein